MVTDNDRVRLSCEAKLKELEPLLEVISSLTVQSLCDLVSRLCGKPIRLVPMSMRAYSGLCFRKPEAYVILYDSEGDPFYEALVVFHELAHILLGHVPVRLDSEEERAGKGGTLQSHFMTMEVSDRLGFARATYNAEEDQEAELLGRMLHSRFLRSQGVASSQDPRVAGPLQRFARHRRGHIAR